MFSKNSASNYSTPQRGRAFFEPTVLLKNTDGPGILQTVILDRHPEIRRLSPAEKLALVAELWDDVSSHPENVPVSPEHLAELDRRMAEYRRDPSKVTSWEAIKARILGPAANP
jgi:putative addiction module component (TIGR02574 family)